MTASVPPRDVPGEVSRGGDRGLLPKPAGDLRSQKAAAPPGTALAPSQELHRDSRDLLRADCQRCQGLCCVIPGFSHSADFAITKAPGTPCPNLGPDHRCTIHSQLRQQGFAGCTVYDCFGAGQQVCQETFPGQSWRSGQSERDAMFTAFRIVRDLNELRWYLWDVVSRPQVGALAAELQRSLDQLTELAAGTPGQLSQIDLPELWQATATQLAVASREIRGVPDAPAADPTSSRTREASPGPGQPARAASGRRRGKRGNAGGGAGGGAGGAARAAGDTDSRGGIPSDLQGAHLAGRRLAGERLSGANLAGADLTGSDLRRARLDHASLLGACLNEAMLAQAQLPGVDARGADFHRSDLAGADLRGAQLTTANLRGAILIGADLSGCDLTRADLLGSDLRGAQLSGALLAEALFVTNLQVSAARGDAHTSLPRDVQRPAHW